LPTFSNYLRSEIEDEIQSIIPEIGDIVGVISHIRKQIFSVDEFRVALKSQRHVI
jgi:hypothetical protein